MEIPTSYKKTLNTNKETKIAHNFPLAYARLLTNL